MSIWDWLLNSLSGTKDSRDSAIPAAPFSAPALPQPAPKPPPPEPPPPHYGIDEAMALMRALPLDEEPELVLRVVRKTLRSTGVSVEELVASARKREIALTENIADDRKAIARLEGEIADRKAHIEEVVARLEETEGVRKRLQEAMESESKVGALLPPHELLQLQSEHAAAASRPPPPKPSAAPPVPRVLPPPLKKSLPPRPPAAPKIGSLPAKKEPVALDSDALESASESHPPSEPTLKVEVDGLLHPAPSAAGGPDKNKK